MVTYILTNCIVYIFLIIFDYLITLLSTNFMLQLAVKPTASTMKYRIVYRVVKLHVWTMTATLSKDVYLGWIKNSRFRFSLWLYSIIHNYKSTTIYLCIRLNQYLQVHIISVHASWYKFYCYTLHCIFYLRLATNDCIVILLTMLVISAIPYFMLNCTGEFTKSSI